MTAPVQKWPGQLRQLAIRTLILITRAGQSTRGGGGPKPTAPRPTPARRGRRMPVGVRRMGTGDWPVPLVRTAGGGDGCRRYAPFGSGAAEPERDELACPRPTSPASAPCACRPSGRRSGRLRTSAGVATFLPPTSRMTSPVLKPCSEATPSGSTLVTTTPSVPLPATCAGRSEREAEPRHVACRRQACCVGAAARARAASAIRRASARSSSPRPCATRSASPSRRAPCAPICLARSRASLTGLPLTAVITSPARMPALTRRAVRLRLGDQRALRRLQAEAVGDVGGDRLDLHADPAAGHRCPCP